MAFLIGSIWFGSNYYDRIYLVGRGFQSHLAGVRFGFFFIFLPLTGGLVGLVRWVVDPQFMPSFNTPSGWGWLSLPLLWMFGYGLLTLKRWAIYILGVLFCPLVVGILRIIYTDFSPDHLAWRIAMLFVAAGMLFLNAKAGLKYVRERWHEYR